MRIDADIVSRFIRNYRKRERALLENGVRPLLFNRNGYVLAVVLVITTILMTVTGEFVITARTDIGLMNKYKNRIRAIYVAKSGIELAKYVLFIDEKGASSTIQGISSDRNVDSYRDIWAFDFPPVPIDDGSMTIAITDEQSKINLSVLASEVVDSSPYYGMVQNFFIRMGFTPDLADGIIDWVDIDETPFPYGAESDYYRRQTPSYAARNASMESINDLLLIKGITPEIFYGLGGGNFGMERDLVEDNKGSLTFEGGSMKEMSRQIEKIKKESGAKETHRIGPEKSRRLPDYFRVYGERGNYLDEINKININTAPFRVLSALTPDMTDDKVAELIMRRLIEPFKAVSEISDLITDQDVRTKLLTVKSALFGITSTASFGNATITIRAVYNRETRKILYWQEE